MGMFDTLWIEGREFQTKSMMCKLADLQLGSNGKKIKDGSESYKIKALLKHNFIDYIFAYSVKNYVYVKIFNGYQEWYDSNPYRDGKEITKEEAFKLIDRE